MKTRIAKKSCPTEADEQIQFVTWAKKQGYRIVASGNGGSRNFLEAVKFKKMGISAGFPDLFVPIPSGTYHGLFIELKRIKGSKTSVEQVEWIEYLRNNGYYADFAYGFEQAKEIILHYLSLTPTSS